MILKIKIKKSKEDRQIIAWIQNSKDFNEDLKQLFTFFKEDIKIKEKRRVHIYYKVTSENTSVMLSLISTIIDLIPEIYFKPGNSL
jgi:DNA-binding transcriptional regulator WhiA